MKEKKSRNRKSNKRPKEVWNSLRKLEGHLKRAEIESTIFMNTLTELRSAVSFDVRKDIVLRLCENINGDILHALNEYVRDTHDGRHRESLEVNVMLEGVLDSLMGICNLNHVYAPGDKLTVRRESVKDYQFEEYPETLDDEAVKSFEVEVITSGWSIDGQVVVKPRVAEAKGPRGASLFDGIGVEQTVSDTMVRQ